MPIRATTAQAASTQALIRTKASSKQGRQSARAHRRGPQGRLSRMEQSPGLKASYDTVLTDVHVFKPG